MPWTAAITGWGSDCIICMTVTAEVENIAILGDGLTAHLLEIVTGAEGRPGRSQDHRADGT